MILSKTIISPERKLLEHATDEDVEGPNALVSDYIRADEKLVRMYSAIENEK